jgi:hypothetical protein
MNLSLPASLSETEREKQRKIKLFTPLSEAERGWGRGQTRFVELTLVNPLCSLKWRRKGGVKFCIRKNSQALERTASCNANPLQKPGCVGIKFGAIVSGCLIVPIKQVALAPVVLINKVGLLNVFPQPLN